MQYSHKFNYMYIVLIQSVILFIYRYMNNIHQASLPIL